ncbi:MAG: protein kinase, partial [Rhodobacterales bacterium]|nr:protein kinase [Rhodobacterales bacterium]
MAEETITGRLIAKKFKVTGLQRSGRMGDVYVARRIENNARVSIKILDPALFGEQEAKKRFEREARITLRLDHPCTLVVEEFGRTNEGWPYMALEYVNGELLAEIIEDAGKVEASRAAYIVAQIAMALDAAHALGVIHRDMCPNNVLISEVAGQADSVKVLEFGLSRMEGSESEESSLTAVGVRIGSPFYMAPEYIEEYALDHRADLYALGIVLFEMLTGKPPFHGRPYKVMDMHLSEVPPAPSSLVQGVAPWLDKLVADLLVKDPDLRIQTAAEVVRRIEKGLGERLQTVQSKASVSATSKPHQRQATPVPTLDPLLDQYIQQQIKSVKRSKGKAPDRRHCLVVDR